MEETLICSQCSKEWNRLRSRGRKPVVCPDCVANNTQPPEQIQKSTSLSVDSKTNSSKPVREKNDLARVYQSLYPRPRDAEDLRNQNPSGSTWKCTNCGYILKTGVALSDVPTHKCNPDSVRVRALTRIS